MYNSVNYAAFTHREAPFGTISGAHWDECGSTSHTSSLNDSISIASGVHESINTSADKFLGFLSPPGTHPGELLVQLFSSPAKSSRTSPADVPAFPATVFLPPAKSTVSPEKTVPSPANSSASPAQTPAGFFRQLLASPAKLFVSAQGSESGPTINIDSDSDLDQSQEHRPLCIPALGSDSELDRNISSGYSNMSNQVQKSMLAEGEEISM
jgi:hypothetical protein